MKHPKALSYLSSCFALTLIAQACSQGTESDPDDGGSSASTDSGTSAITGDTDSDDSSGSTGITGDIEPTSGTDTTTQTEGGGGGGPVCETASSSTEIPPVYLAFAFDVSGSMGKLDSPHWWHDPVAKWEPVVEATSAFFSDPASEGINASMAFFPADDDKCESESYVEPNVAMTALPSNDFSAAFAEYEDEVGGTLVDGDWRGGTPTTEALTGVGQSLLELRDLHPEAKFALVLVTDGLPQDCDNDLDGAKSTAADYLADGLPTYVIGIENPMTPPDVLPEHWSDWGDCPDDSEGGDETPCTPPATLSALNEIAVSGGTDGAFLIDTGSPNDTQLAFRAAIEAIRGSSLSCSLPIPENPEGGAFEPDNVDVTITSGATVTRLGYDAACTYPMSWHYDDESAPTAIELCESTCTEIKARPDVDFEVNFLCEPREPILR